MALLTTRSVDAGYGNLQVLYDINLEIEEGTITVIVGPNGSGKSTLLKTIFGLTKVYKGSITFMGKEITHLKPYERARLGLIYLPQLRNIFTRLTVRENFVMGCYLEPEKLEERIDYVLELFPELKGYMDRRAWTLSGGLRQMLGMAMNLMRHPKLLMLDEPTANLAPKITGQVFKKIEELRDNLGITIVLVEQNAKRALEVGDYAYLLVAGRIMFKGTCEELLNHPELAKIYLGIIDSK